MTHMPVSTAVKTKGLSAEIIMLSNHIVGTFCDKISKITFERLYVSKRKRGKFILNDTSTDM